jgi:acetyl-CoA carboxylase beta subunit
MSNHWGDVIIPSNQPYIEETMNWISNVVRPKIRSFLRRETPENLWIKCPETGQLVFYKDVEANQFVIPSSNYHMRISAPLRLKAMFDDGEFEDIVLPEVPLDPLKFRDERRYADRLKDARAKSGLQDAVKLGIGRLEGQMVTIAVQDFDFMGGSLGMAAGEAVITGLETAVRRQTPFIMFAASGGARMQEGRRANAARNAQAIHRGPDKSDHRRRHCLLRDAWRCANRRARGVDRICRPARDRTDHS